MLNDLALGWQIVISASLLIGGLFTLIGAVGMVRFPDFYMRLHAPTKATTLGVGGILLGSVLISWLQGQLVVSEVLIVLFVFITAPVSANLMAKAAMHLRVPSKAGEAPQQDGERDVGT